MTSKRGWLPNSPCSEAEGPAPPGQGAAVPGGCGKGCGERGFIAKCEAGIGEGAGLQEFNS